MKYKKGDKVRVRNWAAMEREFGVDEYHWIKTPLYNFTPMMGKYCGKTVTIKEVYDDYYKIEEDNFSWTDDMFEGYAFEYGEKVFVSDDGLSWEPKIYVGYIDGDEKPYICVSGLCEDDFYAKRKFRTLHWRYARPTQKKHTIVIDGREIQISEKSYNKLKESLLK